MFTPLNVLRVALAATLVVAVAELSRRQPRWGALLLSLPLTSILAFSFGWWQHGDLPTLAKMARDTIVLVLLGLPFFLPLAVAPQWGLGFWPALLLGVAFASIAIGLWMYLG